MRISSIFLVALMATIVSSLRRLASKTSSVYAGWLVVRYTVSMYYQPWTGWSPRSMWDQGWFLSTTASIQAHIWVLRGNHIVGYDDILPARKARME